MEETRNSTLQHPGAVGSECTHSESNSVPGHHGDPSAEYAALKSTAALVERAQSVLRLTGKDPAGMLNAILTNDVPKEDFRGVYAALLDQKGRVQTDLRVLKDGEDILILTEPEGAEAARAILGRYAPFSRVKVEDLTGIEDPWTTLGVYGPNSASLIGTDALEEHETRTLEAGGATALTVGVSIPVPGYELVGPANEIQKIRERLIENGALLVGSHAYETARIEAGTPRFGPDITPENFPAEAGILERAISFSKGCYPGQETVARMHYRGHPNRTLHRLIVEGAAPTPGTPILQKARQVGRITSVAPLPVEGKTLALGYLHRNADLDKALVAGEAKITPLVET